MSIKLDVKDRKILYLLLEDASLTPAEIGRLVRLSKGAVGYRIKQMTDSGVILKFLPIVNHQRIGLNSYDIFFKFKANVEQEEKIKDWFRAHPNLVWGTSLFGKWDLFVQMLARDPEEFTRILKEVTLHLGDRLDNYEVKTLVERLKIRLQLYDFRKEIQFVARRPAYGSGRMELDDTDRRLLGWLNRKVVRVTYREAGRAAGITMETARNRLKAMFREGAIERWMVMADHRKLGFMQYLVFLSLRHLTPEIEKALANFMQGSSAIKIVFKERGKLEYYFFVVVEGQAELERLVKEIKSRFFEVILGIDHMAITEELQLNYFPPGLWEKSYI